MGITRKQLKSFGSTDYLVKRLTENLQPIGRKKRAYEYDKEQLLNAIRKLMDAPGNRKTTKAMLAHLEVKVSGVFEGTNISGPLLEAMRRVSEANARFQQTAAKARKIADEFQEYKKKHSSDFIPRNNIVAFKK